MIYAMSDLHGCYEKYVKMLEKIDLKDDDTLYILGDVVDRGDGGIRILQDMMTRKNIIAIKGNHDHLAYRLLKMLKQPSDMYDSEKTIEIFRMWLNDGGSPTLEEFKALPLETQKKVLAYMNSFLIYDEVEAGGKSLFLSHTVPAKTRMQNFDTIKWQELIIGEPEYEKEYFPDKYIVTGHTPTSLINEKFTGKIFQANHHIAIDCGAVFGNPLGCISLDTLQEFYVE